MATTRYILRLTRQQDTARLYRVSVVRFDGGSALVAAGIFARVEDDSPTVEWSALVEGRDAAERAGLDYIRCERPTARRIKGPAGPLNLWEDDHA